MLVFYDISLHTLVHIMNTATAASLITTANIASMITVPVAVTAVHATVE
jgi:hypothetical protein